MADKIEYSRMLVKRTDQTGEVPTVPPITAVTLNQFIPTDLFVGEFFLNEVDDLLWIRTSNGILPISLSGSTGTTTTPTLTQVLFQGNVTNGYNIDVSAGDTIIFQGLNTGSTNNVLGIDASGNTIVTSATGGTIIVTGDYLPLSGGTVTGNTYFGSTSGITMDQVNKRLGINTATPQYTIEAFGLKSNITYQDTAGGVFQISGDTFLPRFNAAGAPSGSKPVFSVSMGVRTYDDITYPGYGKVADGFVYASNEANGLNIINRQGTGTTEDYIRFYAGQDANGTMPDIHIQGSGSTRGYVGFGTETPVEKVDIRGNVRVIGQSYVSLPSTGTTTSATTISWDSGNIQELVLGANTTFTFTNGKAGATYILVVQQSSGGNNTITWPGSVTWAGGSTPTMTITANRFDVYTFIYDGNKYFGSYVQNFI
jgi:hypothetical protein